MNKLIMIILSLLLFLTGCNSTTNSQLPVITTTVYPISLIVEQLAGEEVIVNQVYPQGADVHSYEPTSKDMITIADSDIVFYISDGEDPFISAIKADDNDETKYVNISEHELFKNNVDSNYYAITEHDDGTTSSGEEIIDPHIWISPKLDILIANVIASELEAIGVDVASNLDSLVKELSEVDRAYQDFGANQTNALIVSHDAYGYLTSEYGIEVISLYGMNHDDEPSSKEIADVIDYINDNSISKIYLDENETNKNLMSQIASETNAELSTLLTISTESNITQDMTLVDCLNYNLAQMEN